MSTGEESKESIEPFKPIVFTESTLRGIIRRHDAIMGTFSTGLFIPTIVCPMQLLNHSSNSVTGYVGLTIFCISCLSSFATYSARMLNKVLPDKVGYGVSLQASLIAGAVTTLATGSLSVGLTSGIGATIIGALAANYTGDRDVVAREDFIVEAIRRGDNRNCTKGSITAYFSLPKAKRITLG